LAFFPRLKVGVFLFPTRFFSADGDGRGFTGWEADFALFSLRGNRPWRLNYHSALRYRSLRIILCCSLPSGTFLHSSATPRSTGLFRKRSECSKTTSARRKEAAACGEQTLCLKCCSSLDCRYHRLFYLQTIETWASRSPSPEPPRRLSSVYLPCLVQEYGKLYPLVECSASC
jgi:hypothetical protein